MNIFKEISRVEHDLSIINFMADVVIIKKYIINQDKKTTYITPEDLSEITGVSLSHIELFRKCARIRTYKRQLVIKK